jgi:phospholipase/carboxylesterase
VPQQYEPQYAYPLVVWLHGPGSDETQLRTVMARVSVRNYVGVAPRGTDECVDESGRMRGYRWREHEDHVFLARQRVTAAVAAASERYHVASHRVFLVGHRSGGTMALRLAFEAPERFAGAVSLLGPFPRGRAPLGRLNLARSLPVLLAAGRFSTRYGDAQAAEDLRLLHAAGVPVTVRLYPCRDRLGPAVLADVNRWIMREVCPDPAVVF